MASKRGRPLWLPIQHHDVHDVPRTVIVHDEERRLLLHSRNDPTVGGFTPYYAVARLPDGWAPATPSWDDVAKHAERWLGEIDVTSVVFDQRRTAVRSYSLRAFLDR